MYGCNSSPHIQLLTVAHVRKRTKAGHHTTVMHRPQRHSQNELVGAVMCGLLQKDASPLERIGFVRGADGELSCRVCLQHDVGNDDSKSLVIVPDMCSYTCTLKFAGENADDDNTITCDMKFAQVEIGMGTWQDRVTAHLPEGADPLRQRPPNAAPSTGRVHVRITAHTEPACSGSASSRKSKPFTKTIVSGSFTIPSPDEHHALGHPEGRRGFMVQVGTQPKPPSSVQSLYRVRHV